MVAKNIRCVVIEVSPTSRFTKGRVHSVVRRRRLSSDPFIAGLVRKLQQEVRAERRCNRLGGHAVGVDEFATVTCEAPPPLGESPLEFELPEYDDDPLPPRQPN